MPGLNAGPHFISPKHEKPVAHLSKKPKTQRCHRNVVASWLVNSEPKGLVFKSLSPSLSPKPKAQNSKPVPALATSQRY